MEELDRNYIFNLIHQTERVVSGVAYRGSFIEAKEGKRG